MIPDLNRVRVCTGRIFDCETGVLTVTDRRDLIYDGSGRLLSMRKVRGRKPRCRLTPTNSQC